MEERLPKKEGQFGKYGLTTRCMLRRPVLIEADRWYSVSLSVSLKAKGGRDGLILPLCAYLGIDTLFL